MKEQEAQDFEMFLYYLQSQYPNLIYQAQQYNINEALPNPSPSEINNIVACCERVLCCPYSDRPLEEKGIRILYRIIKNHYLQNGNKRVASYVFLYYLQAMEITYTFTNDVLMDIAKEIAAIKGNDEDRVCREMKQRLFGE